MPPSVVSVAGGVYVSLLWWVFNLVMMKCRTVFVSYTNGLSGAFLLVGGVKSTALCLAGARLRQLLVSQRCREGSTRVYLTCLRVRFGHLEVIKITFLFHWPLAEYFSLVGAQVLFSASNQFLLSDHQPCSFHWPTAKSFSGPNGQVQSTASGQVLTVAEGQVLTTGRGLPRFVTHTP